MYYFVYVLLSQNDGNLYTGYTSDLKERMNEHNSGKVKSTKERRPLELVYFEGCLNRSDATQREKYLKTSYGKKYLKNRLRHFLNNF